MQIAVCGRGPAMVLLHGWAMHGDIFAPLVARLQNDFTLHIVDLPGHGRSADSPVALELDAVAGHLATNVPRAIWLGWSLGGLFALQAAQRFQESVRGLVMLCASARFVAADNWPQGMDASVFSGFARALADDYRGTIDRFLMLEAQGTANVREEVRLMRAQIFSHGEPSKDRLLEGLGLLQNSDLREGLPTMATPSLWLASRLDRLVTSQAMLACAGLTRAGRHVQSASGGHAPFLSHPDEIADNIKQFAESLPA